jgi:hypothetical protein
MSPWPVKGMAFIIGKIAYFRWQKDVKNVVIMNQRIILEALESLGSAQGYPFRAHLLISRLSLSDSYQISWIVGWIQLISQSH